MARGVAAVAMLLAASCLCAGAAAAAGGSRKMLSADDAQHGGWGGGYGGGWGGGYGGGGYMHNTGHWDQHGDHYHWHDTSHYHQPYGGYGGYGSGLNSGWGGWGRKLAQIGAGATATPAGKTPELTMVTVAGDNNWGYGNGLGNGQNYNSHLASFGHFGNTNAGGKSSSVMLGKRKA